MTKLVLVQATDDLKSGGDGPRAVMFEKAAAKYCLLAIQDFRKLVTAGSIPCRHHLGRTRRIYLREDLDNYLRALPRGGAKMPAGEESPDLLRRKGVSFGR